MDNRKIEEIRENETKLIDEIKQLEKENQELKKQLSNDYQIKMKQLQQENRKLKQQLSNSHQIKNQQKEFIEWLENLINNANKVLDNPKEDEEIKSYVLSRKFVLEHVLSKYKEIIGVDNE